MNFRVSRRRFNELVVANCFLLAFGQASKASTREGTDMGGTAGPVDGNAIGIKLNVNGKAHELEIDPRSTLLDVVRERLGLTGSKKGCDHGQCGACTMLVDGRRINSCLSLAVIHDGDEITTIEGVGKGDELHPLQEAFIDHDGFQCGYCTPGQIMSGISLLAEPCGPSDADVKECMSGNLCRCGAYPNIVAAIQQVRNGGRR